MRKSFSYSVLKYRPSAALDEQLNIGVLLSFPMEKKLVFIAPSQLNRLEWSFPDLDIIALQSSLNQLKKKAYEMTLAKQDISHEAAKVRFIPSEFEGLYFSKQVDGSYLTVDSAVQYYNRMYFDIYRKVFRKSVENL